MKKNITEILGKKRLYFDGGTGTCLQKAGLPAGTAPEEWNLTEPEKILALHREYLDAGADIIKTNTFGVNPLKYENYRDYTESAMEIAVRAIGELGEKYIAFDIGPLGRLISPLGDLPFEDAVGAFCAMGAEAKRLGADLVLIETMNDSYEAKAAVLGVREACELPIFVTCVYDGGAKLMTGAEPEAMIAILESLGVSALGMNCSLGPDKMLGILPRFLNAASVPVIVNPNAGLPTVRDGVTYFDTGAEEYAEIMKKMAECGAHILGGCCGTTPEYIRLMRAACESVKFTPPTEKNLTVVSSYTHAVRVDSCPLLIGERINPTGKPKLKEALRREDIDYVITEALREADRGAHILDVNVGLPEIDEPRLMMRCVEEIQAVCDTPLQIDSSDPEALEAAMRIYNGKPLVNSVNAKRESMEKVFPLVKKYGGALIALTITEDGIPETAEGRVMAAEKIIREAEKWGIQKKDIIVDPLALSVSADMNAPRVTLDAIKMLTERGIKTSLGVSNVSFGLPERDNVNSAFFTAAMTCGLSMAIMNPYSEKMLAAYRAYRALSGADVGCADYISAYADVKKEEEKGDSGVSLRFAVRRGIIGTARAVAEQMLKEREPLDIINGEIIPALDEVGAEFESGRAFLPELLASADAASAAFLVIKEKIPKSSTVGESIILATVKGDVHDIGKNIVKVMLESYGYSVIDLGRDVAPERILSAARESGARLVGLSALMTTTVAAMKDTVELLHRELPGVKVMVGGAVLNSEYAQMIGADFYGKDAMEAVGIAKKNL